MKEYYRHPRELEELSGLLHNQVIQLLIGAYHKLRAQATDFAELRNRNFRVTRQNCRRGYDLFQQAKQRLHVTELVTLYTEFGYGYTARLLGTDGDAAIVLSSKCLEDMDDDTLTALLGRQLAHVQCRHVDLLNVDAMLEPLLQQIPFVGAAAVEVSKGLLLSWKQCAELTADRGGAIACGSADPVMDAILYQLGAKSAGLSCAALLERQTPLTAVNTTVANTVIQRLLKDMEAPFGLQRIWNLQHWSHSDGCRRTVPQIYWNSFYGTGHDTGLSARDDWQQALLDRERNDRDAFLTRLHLAARKGSGEAMTLLGMHYMQGTEELPQDAALGLSYIRRAAFRNDAGGQYRLSQLYRAGIPGLLEPNSQMADWLLRAAYGQKYPQAAARIQAQPIRVASISDARLKRLWRSDGVPLQAETEDKLRAWLWVPRQDAIAAWEIAADDDAQPEAIAIADTGIYLRRDGGLPRWISWTTFFQEACTAAALPHSVQLQLNGVPIWHGDPQDPSGIIYKLIAIAKARPS